MKNSKINLFDSKWIDTVFEGRNKSYGAYDLRVRQSSITIKAFLIGASAFLLLVNLPSITKLVASNVGGRNTIDEKIVLFTPPPLEKAPEKVVVPPPPPPKEVVKANIKEVVKFTPPKVVPEDVNEIPPQSAFVDAVAGAKSSPADPDGDPVIVDTPPVVVETPATTIIENPIIDVHLVEVKPEPNGGMAEFYKFISKNFNVPEVGHTLTAKIYVSFVVDKDGTLTNIKVLRDAGYGTGEEAIRVLKKMKPWKPGIQNGRPVKVAYSLPIVIQIQ